jgi:trk system potassium uptake protein TrkA
MPNNSALVTLQRGNRLIIPEPDDVLQAGDEMLFIAGSAVEDRIKAMVHGTAPLRHSDADSAP